MDNNSISEASVLQEPAQIFYMETSGSSRDTPTSITTSSLEENKENLSSSSNLHPAEVSCVSGGPNLNTSQTEDPQDQSSSPHKLATPTLVMSQDRCRMWSSSTEETMIQGPALFTTPTTSAAVEGAGPGVEEIVVQTDPDVSSADAPPMSSFSPPAERLLPPPSDDFTGQPGGDEDEESLRVQQVVNELRQAARRAVHLFQQLGESGQTQQNLSVLQEAFCAVNSELQAVMQPEVGRSSGGGRSRCGGRSSSDPSGSLQDDGTTSLLEKYSDLLIQMTLNKMNRI